MKQKTMKKIIAFVLTLCLAVPTVNYSLLPETQAADTTSVIGEVGDTNGDGTIDSTELVRIKKGQSGDDSYKKAKFDLNNDGKYDETDAKLMREFLCGKIYSFYRPDTSKTNNDTYYYSVTDALDREMAVAKAAKADKKVGIRYFLHFGAEESNPLYSVSEILKKDSSAYETGSKWVSAGGGAVGTKHWWGEPLFGYYFSTDAWVADRDVQMLTDAGIDFIAIDTSENKINEAGLTVLLEALNKYYKQGFNVPKVTFTSMPETLSPALESFYNNTEYLDLWYKSGESIVASTDTLTMKTVHAAKSVGGAAMSASAFYGNTTNHQRSFNGSINSDDEDATLQGYNFAREFESAIKSGADTIFVESWNEWISERKASDNESKPIVLNENADMNNSSDIQPMKDGYGDDYYMQMIDYIKQFKGSTITNNRLNTATANGGVSIDINGDFSQWNKVSSHYLDYTGDIANRDSDGYETAAPGEVKEDNKAAAITINSAGAKSFITKETYAGGSTVSLRVYIPEGATWWAVCWTTDVNSADKYAWLPGNGGLGTSVPASETQGAWIDKTFTLPAGGQYYVYIVGAEGEWGDRQLLIDTVTIKDSIGNVTVEETFNNGLADSIFSCDASAVSLTDGEEIKETPEEPTNTNQAVAITINQLNENAPMSFITKNAYAGGSTVSFRAYVPTGASWWAVCWTTDPSNTDLYKWTGGDAYGKSMTSEADKWADYSVTLPSDSNTYYVYVVGAKGEWKDAGGNALSLLIDNVEIKAAGGNVTAKETFNNGLADSIFTCGNGVTLTEGETLEEPTNTNQAAAITINQLNENAPMSFITKNAYAGGSTVSFRAYVPEGAQWWAVCWTTDPSDTDLYKWTGGDAYGKSMPSTTGAWADYSVTLPSDSSTYYVYVVGAKGEWKDAGGNALSLLIDNVEIKDGGGNVTATETFDNGLANSIFSCGESVVTLAEGDAEGVTPEEPTEPTKTYTDKSGRNDISRMKMTTDGINLYCLVETVDAIQGFGSANCMSLFISTGNVGGCYNQYEYVVNRDSSKAADGKLIVEKYVGGAWKEVGSAAYRLEGNKLQLAIPLSALNCDEVFSLEFKWADNYKEDDVYSFYTSGDAAPYGRVNYVFKATASVAAINIDLLNENSPMNFITKNAYAGGSTVSFRAYVPTGASWWAVCWTTDPSDTGLYKWTGSNPQGQSMTSKTGEWEEYNVTLPDDENKYYIYIVGAKGEWNGKQLLIDDFTITSGDVVKKDNFNGGFTQGLFDVTEKNDSDKTVVELQTTGKTTSNQAAALKVKYLNENVQDFATNCAYPGGSTISFRAYVPESWTSDAWWGVAYATDLSTIDIYKCAASPYNMIGVTKKGEWADYSITLPNDGENYYLAIGGEVGGSSHWGENELLIDDVKVTNADGQLIAKDSFSEGFSKGLFDVAGTAVSLVDETASPVSGNQAATIKIANMTESTARAFISKNAYPAGSTITFDGLVPAELGEEGWWRVAWTTDPNTGGMYVGNDVSQNMASVRGTWSNYTVNLPADGGPYYFYIVGPEGDSKWKSGSTPLSLWIDNVKVTDASGDLLASDDFNHAFSKGMFNVTEGNVVSLEEVATTASGDNIDFTAYSAPTVNRQVTASDVDKLETAYAKLSEAGFNKAIAMTEGYPGTVGSGTPTADQIQERSVATEEAAGIVLDIAEKHNVSYLVKDWSFYGLGAANADENAYSSSQVSTDAQFKTVIENIFDSGNTYVDHSAYAGNFAFDEPYLKDLDAVAKQYTYFNQQVGTKGEMFVNLLGSYVSKNSKQFGTIWDQIFGSATGTYEGYVDTYLSKVGTDLGYICWDNYPFMEEGHEDKAERDKNYLSNYELIANKCKTNGVELRTFVQARGDSTGIRTLNGVEDLRFQIYSGLAFGVKEFVYYTYSGSATDADANNCLFDYENQNYTKVYDYAKQVNNGVHAMEEIYSQYKWTDIMYKKVSSGNVRLENLSTANTSGTYGNTEIESCSADTLAGVFTAKDTTGTCNRENAYMFVNVADPTEKKTDEVTVNFKDGAAAVSVYQSGKHMVIPISSNQYKFTLAPGEGIFVVPLQAK